MLSKSEGEREDISLCVKKTSSSAASSRTSQDKTCSIEPKRSVRPSDNEREDIVSVVKFLLI